MQFKKVLNSLILISCISFCTSCVSKKSFNEKITQKHAVNSIIQDIDFVFKQLKKGHSGLTWYIEEQQLVYKFDSLKNTIDEPLTSLELYKKLAPIVVSIRCGHTRLIMPYSQATNKQKIERSKYLNPLQQFTFRIIEDKLYVYQLRNNQISQIQVGDEILAIDGRPVEEIFTSLKSVFSSDGYNETFKNAFLNKSFPYLYSLMYVVNSSIQYTVRRKDSIQNFKIETFNTKNIKKNINDSTKQLNVNFKVRLKQKYRGFDGPNDYLLTFKILDSTKRVAYLKVKSFKFPKANFSRFFKETFAEIKAAKIEHLILDLRDNTGGKLLASKELFAYLSTEDFQFIQEPKISRIYNPFFHQNGLINKIKGISFYVQKNQIFEKEGFLDYRLKYKGTSFESPKNDNYKNNLYVIINGNSFSASSLLSANIQEKRKAIFVGQETGGASNGCVAGSISRIQLSNTKLILSMGLYPVKPAVKSYTYGRGIFPEVRVWENEQDFLNKRDPELNWILNDIHFKNISSKFD